MLIGAIALKLHGILVPVVERAGGPIAAWFGWTLPNEDTRTGTDAMAAEQRVDYIGQAF